MPPAPAVYGTTDDPLSCASDHGSGLLSFGSIPVEDVELVDFLRNLDLQQPGQPVHRASSGLGHATPARRLNSSGVGAGGIAASAAHTAAGSNTAAASCNAALAVATAAASAATTAAAPPVVTAAAAPAASGATAVPEITAAVAGGTF
jgi:hypothetical protein